MTLIEKKTYKGRDIYIIEDALGQTFNVVIGCFNKIFHSTADAKRYINGEVEPYKYLPITPSTSGNFNEIMGFARKNALQALQAEENPAKPATPEQEFEAQREALKSELEGIMGEAKERVEEFVHDSLKRYGDYRIVGGYTPDHFTIALHNGEKPVWGAHFDVYVDKNWETKKTDVRLNIGTAGSFALGNGSERESLYLAFAKFINDVNDWGLGRYLIRVHEKANDVWHRFGKLCDQYKKNSCHVSLFGD